MLLLKLAFRNIFRQRRRSLLTALSIGGGYILCTLALSMTIGTFENAKDAFTLDHTGHIQIHKGNYLRRPKIYNAIDIPDQLSEKLDANADISSHTLRIFAPALAYSDTGNTSVRVIGVDLERERTTSRLAQKVSQGNYINDQVDVDGRYAAMIGAGVADTLELKLGDEIILISQGADGSIANDIYIVNAIIGARDSRDKQNVFLPLNASQEFLSLFGKIHEISLVLKDDNKTLEIAAALQAQLSGFTVSPWQVIETSFYQTMVMKQQSNYVTFGIILFIVFVGVLNAVLMSVLERTREFGVLKAIGSRPAAIAGLITLETSMIAALSVAAGFLISLPIIAWLSIVGIEYPEPMDLGGVTLTHVTGEMSVFIFSLPMIVILLSAIIVSIPPGLRAAYTAPTEAMRSH